MSFEIFFILFYIVPMILSTLILYFDEEMQTIGDMLKAWWAVLIPLMNIITLLLLCTYLVNDSKPVAFIRNKWTQFMNTKIK